MIKFIIYYLNIIHLFLINFYQYSKNHSILRLPIRWFFNNVNNICNLLLNTKNYLPIRNDYTASIKKKFQYNIVKFNLFNYITFYKIKIKKKKFLQKLFLIKENSKKIEFLYIYFMH